MRPLEGNYKINVDGSSRGANGRAACGVVCRGPDGEFKATIAHFLGSSSALVAEAFGLLEGIKLAVNLKITKVEFESDSKNIVGFMSSSSEVIPWSVISIIEEEQHLCNSFHSWTIKHIYREANKVADALANFESEDYPCSWLNFPPVFISSLLNSDYIGGSTVRSINTITL